MKLFTSIIHWYDIILSNLKNHLAYMLPFAKGVRRNSLEEGSCNRFCWIEGSIKFFFKQGWFSCGKDDSSSKDDIFQLRVTSFNQSDILQERMTFFRIEWHLSIKVDILQERMTFFKIEWHLSIKVIFFKKGWHSLR